MVHIFHTHERFRARSDDCEPAGPRPASDTTIEMGTTNPIHQNRNAMDAQASSDFPMIHVSECGPDERVGKLCGGRIRPQTTTAR